MSNRSYLYTHHPREKPRFRDFAEWRTDPPLAHFLLVGAGATPCRSAIWKTRKNIAIRGDARQTRPVFLAFLDWLEPQLPRAFAKAAMEARPMLLRADRQGIGFHLELGEIYELIGLELDEMEEETFSNATRAEALFEEVLRLIGTEGTTIRDSTDERIRGLADHWEGRLGLFFSGIVYFHLGGGLNPNVRLVKIPPIPAPSRARGRGAAGESAKPKRNLSQSARKGQAVPPGDPSLADWQHKIVTGRRMHGLVYDIPVSDRVGWLYLAIINRHTDEAKQLITSGIDVNALHELGDGASCLEWAAERGDLELVRLIIEHGADVNHVGKNGPALMCAVTSGHVAVYDYLKRLTDRRHRTIAARRVAEMLRPQDERERVRRFSEACGRGLVPTIRRLLKQGIDVDARSAAFQGETPLALASRGRSLPHAANGGYTEIVELLLASGADPNLESYTGRTPLMWVGNPEICRLLMAAGADVHAADDEGRNVLMRLTDAECCRLLMEAGAKPKAVDRSGRGALWHVAWWAKRRQELGWLKSAIDARYDRNLAEIFRLLIAAGATLDPVVEDGETALSLLAALPVPEAKRVLSAAPVRSTRRRAAGS